jgi:hypothetical protein
MSTVYICSKLRGATPEETISNLDRAITLGKQVWDEEGNIPVVPHLQALVMDDHDPDARTAAMLHGLNLLLHCQELRYYDNPSEGMAAEMERAHKMGITIRDYRYHPGGCYFPGYAYPECEDCAGCGEEPCRAEQSKEDYDQEQADLRHASGYRVFRRGALSTHRERR